MRTSQAAPQRSRKPEPQSSSTVDRVRCVLMREQRYLLAQHNSRRRENRSRWGLAGGRVRDRENPQDCLRRELIEELGCRVPYLVELGDWQHRDETHRIFGCEIIRVNSLHGQGILEPGKRVVVEGVAEDGTIEAIRIADAPGFALGVQWHAEYDPQRNPVNRALFAAFGEATRAHS